MVEPFHGVKAAVFIGDALLVYRRDDYPHIPFPNHWDFPGGGREANEMPHETLFRELEEEFALKVHPEVLVWEREFVATPPAFGKVWFMVLKLPTEAKNEIEFGDEGQEWRLVDWQDFLKFDNRVPFLEARMEFWMKDQGISL